jgi:uncharacterized protein (TIGR02271 family)
MRGATIIPVISEHAQIGKRRVKTATVRVRKIINERTQIVEQELSRDSVDVVRISRNQRVAGPQGPRREGNTIVIPVVKQVLRVEKDWILIEEVRLTPRREKHREKVPVTLTEEHIEVERVPAESATSELNPPERKSEDIEKSERTPQKSP